jgi:hypothetical protein
MKTRRVRVVLIVMLLCLMGGVLGYLATERQRQAYNRMVMCRANLTHIGLELLLYAQEHDGRFPSEFGQLDPDRLTTQVFVCPGSAGRSGPIRNVNEWTSYVLCDGRSLRDVESTILAFCPADNHGGKGTVVLFIDGATKWHAKRELITR